MSILAAFFCVIGGTALAGDLELATLLGRPDATQSFVSETLRRSIPLTTAEPEGGFTTEIYSVLHRHGAPRTLAVEVLEARGAATVAALEQAMATAVAEVPVILNVMGSGDYAADCTRMAAYPQTIFVWVAGNEGRRIQPGTEEAERCSAPNILRVAPLNMASQEIPESANVGVSVRLAAPGVNIPVTGPHGRIALRSNGSVAAALVAARLATIAQTKGPSARGADLIRAFFETETTSNPALEDKVESGRVWLGAPL